MGSTPIFFSFLVNYELFIQPRFADTSLDPVLVALNFMNTDIHNFSLMACFSNPFFH